MIIDSHAQIGPHYTGRNNTAEEYLKIMEEMGTSKAVIAPNRPLSGNLSEANDEIEKAVEAYPDRFYGAVRIDPWQREKAIEELERRFANEKMKAIFLHPWEENFQCHRGVVLPIFDYAQTKKLPIIISAGYLWVSHISQVADIARQYPDVKIMATSAGQLDLSGLTLGNVKEVLKNFPNIYMGTAAAVAMEWLLDLIQNAAKGRILFETGYPFFEADLERYRIDHCFDIRREDKEQVYEGNSRNFFNLD